MADLLFAPCCHHHDRQIGYEFEALPIKEMYVYLFAILPGRIKCVARHSLLRGVRLSSVTPVRRG